LPAPAAHAEPLSGRLQLMCEAHLSKPPRDIGLGPGTVG
jgi:hypothetical protein